MSIMSIIMSVMCKISIIVVIVILCFLNLIIKLNAMVVGCNALVHNKCSGLTGSELKYLTLKNRNLKYFCNTCSNGLCKIIELKVLKLFTTLISFITSLISL